MKLMSRLFPKAEPERAPLPATPEPPIVDPRIAALPGSASDELVTHVLGDDAALQLAAIAQLAERLDRGSLDFAAWSGTADRAVVLRVAVACKEPALLPRALARIEDPAELAQLAVDGSSTRLRQLAAERVVDPGTLRELLKQARGHDKNVYRIVKHKVDALNAEQRKATDIVNEAVALCGSLERHATKVHDVIYEPTFDQFLARWLALEPRPAPEVEMRGQRAIERCQGVITAHADKLAQAAAALAADRAAREQRQHDRLAAQEAAAVQSEEETRRRAEVAAELEAQAQARAAREAAEAQLARQLGGLIRMTQAALAEGNTQKASGLRRSIESKWPVAGAVPPHLTRQLQSLDDKLTELKQWKEHAVAPKRLELIEAMEALIGITEKAPVLAERIKALQEEWRTISKGIASEAGEDWERFHKASQTAYKPCQEYFASLARQRQANLEQRKAVLERLTTFEAAQAVEHPNWKLMAQALREAPLEWRRYFPVDREPNRALQAEFDAALARLQARLDAWHAANAADKQALILRARHLLTLEDGREAIDAAKRLQIQWKDIPPTARDKEQALWNEFREVCDAVYQKRQQAQAEFVAGLEANKQKAVALCEDAERIAGLAGSALAEGAATLPALRTAFEALPELPRAEARSLEERFERACDRCAARLVEERAQGAERAVTDLFEAGRHVVEVAWAVAQADGPAREAAKQAADTFIAAVPHWPKGGLQAIKDAMARAETPADAATTERARRLLCIRAELLSDTPTPAEDESLRREYQVQRLMQGMGQGAHADSQDWDAMTLEWIRAGAVAPELHQRLTARFLESRARRRVERPERPAFSQRNARRDRDDDRDRRPGFGGRGGEPRGSGRGDGRGDRGGDGRGGDSRGGGRTSGGENRGPRSGTRAAPGRR